MKTTMIILLASAVMASAIENDTPSTPHPPAVTQPYPLPEAFQQWRDPFWPVGYQPASETEQEERSKIENLKSRINWPALPLRGVTHAGGQRFIAVIEGIGLVEPGDIVSIRKDGLVYRWRIDRVTIDGVASTRLDVTELPSSK